jgi:hypothetical protein
VVRSRRLDEPGLPHAGLAACTMAPVVVEALHGARHFGKAVVVRELLRVSVAAVEPAGPVRLGMVGRLPGHRGETGVTSDPQAGHRYTPSGRRLISGCPHSQAWPPAASGSATILLSVSRSAPPRTPPHSSHLRELRPKPRSSASEQKGQVRVPGSLFDLSMLPTFFSSCSHPLSWTTRHKRTSPKWVIYD